MDAGLPSGRPGTAGRRAGDPGGRHARRAGGHARRHSHGRGQEPRFLGATCLDCRAPQGRALLCCLGDRRRDVLGGRRSTGRRRLRARWTGGPVRPERRVVAPGRTHPARRPRSAATGVLRLEASSGSTTLLATVGGAAHQALVVAWTQDDSAWARVGPARRAEGGLCPCQRRRFRWAGRGPRRQPEIQRTVFEVGPGDRAWSSLPPPPSGATGVALPGNTPPMDAPPVDVFSVNGSALRVFELTPSGATWSRVQTKQVPITYGSSS